jgi:hypothetical protein
MGCSSHTSLTILSMYYKTIPSPLSWKNPRTPVKCPGQRHGPPLDLVPCHLFQPSSPTTNSLVIPPIPTLQWKITQFFPIKPHPPSTSLSSSIPVSAPFQCPINRSLHPRPSSSKCSIKSFLCYQPRQTTKKITQFATPMPCYDLHNSWGHSLDTIDPSKVFQIFLQNPNGLSLTSNILSFNKSFFN